MLLLVADVVSTIHIVQYKRQRVKNFLKIILLFALDKTKNVCYNDNVKRKQQTKKTAKIRLEEGDMEDHLLNFSILSENIFQLQICCNLSPEEMKERKKEVENRLPFAGTTSGWVIQLEDDAEIDIQIAPVKCDSKEGYWHYVAFC